MQAQPGHQQIAQNQQRAQLPAAMAGVARLRPATALQGIHVQGQKGRGDRQVVVQIAQIDDTAGDALEARARAEQAQGVRGGAAEETQQQIAAGQIQRRAHGHAAHQADHAVIGARGHEQADGEVAAPQQPGCEISGAHRPPVETRDRGHGKRQGQRGGQRQGEDGGAGQELAQHELPQRHRQRQHVLEGAAAPLFAPTAHGQRRAQEDQQQGHPLEQRPHVGDVAGEEGFDPEEGKQAHKHKAGQKQPGHGRGKEQLQLFAGDLAEHAIRLHGDLPNRARTHEKYAPGHAVPGRADTASRRFR